MKDIKEVREALENIGALEQRFEDGDSDGLHLRDLEEYDILDKFIEEVEQIQKDGIDYKSECDGLVCAFSKVEKGTKDYERIKKLSNFIDYRMQENQEMDYTLTYIAGLISEDNMESFIKEHIGKNTDDIVSDMKYEMEHNFVVEDDSYAYPKTKSEVL